MMITSGTRKRSVVLVGALGALLIAVAVALNISWIVVHWRTGLLLLVGVLSFAVLIAGLALNTAFLIREIRRSEQHDAFIHAVTHELKTPLASIKLYAQTLHRRHLDRDTQHEFIDIMLDDAERLQTTIDQILLAGKTSASRRVVDPTDVDIGEVVRTCVAVAGKQRHVDAGELRLLCPRPGHGPLVVLGDHEELTAAVTNLIDNAFKYSGDTRRIDVGLAAAGGRQVVVSVRDQGVGMTKDELTHIFRRFYRIPGRLNARVRGAGLGLSIVRAVARRHGGRAFATSAGPGTGSTVTLELPLKSA